MLIFITRNIFLDTPLKDGLNLVYFWDNNLYLNIQRESILDLWHCKISKERREPRSLKIGLNPWSITIETEGTSISPKWELIGTKKSNGTTGVYENLRRPPYLDFCGKNLRTAGSPWTRCHLCWLTIGETRRGEIDQGVIRHSVSVRVSQPFRHSLFRTLLTYFCPSVSSTTIETREESYKESSQEDWSYKWLLQLCFEFYFRTVHSRSKAYRVFVVMTDVLGFSWCLSFGA